MRRIAAVVAVVVGFTLVGFVVAEHLFSRSADAQTIADHYRPLLSGPGLAGLRGGFDELKAAGAELGDTALPRLQQTLGMSDAEFAAFVARDLPGIQHFDAQAPAIVALVQPVIGKMEAIRDDYRRSDQIPVGFLNLRSAPWLFLGIGLLLIGVGGFALLCPGTLASAALLVVGLGIALAPLVIGIPGKVDAAVRVTAVGRIGLAPSTGQRAVAATALFDGMVSDVHTKLEPAFVAQLGEGEAAGRRVFETSFPTLAKFADDWTRTLSAQSHALSDSQVALAPAFANADRIPLEPIPWLFIVPGAVLALLAGASLVPAARRARARAAVPTPAPATSPVTQPVSS
jgi:hypothetical protein